MDDELSPGDAVRVTNGPLADFVGEVVEVDASERKLTVRVDVFDRQVPVELALDQVERLDAP